jgi:hypothetical protein
LQFFDDWCTQHREYWHLRVSQVFDALSLLYEQGGELVRAQLAQLSPSAWTLMVTASVLEAGLTFERLCQVSGLDELEGLRALEELLRGRWLNEETMPEKTQVFGGYAFPRGLIREVVYQEAGCAAAPGSHQLRRDRR